MTEPGQSNTECHRSGGDMESVRSQGQGGRATVPRKVRAMSGQRYTDRAASSSGKEDALLNRLIICHNNKER